MLLIAGHETTTNLISGGLLVLLQHPDQKARLIEDWKNGGDKSGLAVEELMRFVSPVQTTKPRFIAKDVDFAGQALKRGELVMALIASANTDPTKFEHPETLDLFRQPNRHLGFGAGIHYCLGVQLARAETEIALRQLLLRFPELSLACAEDQLKWRKRIGLRSLRHLPINLHRSH